MKDIVDFDQLPNKNLPRDGSVAAVTRVSWEEELKAAGLAAHGDKPPVDLKTINKSRKQKLDFRLFPIYQHIMSIITSCQPTLNELFEVKEDGQLEYTPTATVFSDTSEENAQLVKQIKADWESIKDRPDTVRKAWIKDKVPQDRFTNKGQAYALQLDEIGNAVFNLSIQVMDFQMKLHNLVAQSGDVNV